MKNKKEDESEKDVETTNGVDSPKVEKAGNLASIPSENSPSGIGGGSDIGDNSDAPASCSPQYQAKRDNCSGDGQRMGLPNHPVADTPSEKPCAEDLKKTESDEE